MILEINRFETRVGWIKGEFGLAAAFAVEFDDVDVLDGEIGDEVRVTEGAVGHEDALAVGNVGGGIVPAPFGAQKQLPEVLSGADPLGDLWRCLRMQDEGGETYGDEDENAFHGGEASVGGSLLITIRFPDAIKIRPR